MRLTTVILIASLLQVSASTLAQKITLSKTNAPLKTILQELRQQSGYLFLYSDNVLKLGKPVDIEVNQEDFNKVLEKVFANQPLTYSINKKTIVIKEKEPSFLDKARNVIRKSFQDLKGRVTDDQGKPLPNASIGIKGKSTVINTDANGVFQIKDVASDAVLLVSYVGYKTLEIPVKDAVMPLEIKLNPQTGELEEVKVVYNTGYQGLNKERSTGSFVQIDNELFNRAVGSTVLDRILHVTSGLIVNAAPGEGGNISIRGNSTINANKQPLIVVDNFPYEGNLNNLNPNNVESITVLKDAAAANIWGVRAGNGVIVITTKSGKFNQSARIVFNSNITIGDKPDLLYIPNMSSKDIVDFEAQQFASGIYNDYDDIYPSFGYFPDLPQSIELLLAARKKNSGIPSYNALNDPDVIAKLDNLSKNEIRNDISEYFLQNSVNQQYALNISGGGSNFSYYASLGYDRSKNNNIHENFNRLTIDFNNTWKPIKNLEINGHIVYTRGINNNVGVNYSGFLPGSANRISSYSKLADDQGHSLAISRFYRMAYVDSASYPALLDWHYKPLDDYKFINNHGQEYDARINAIINYSIKPWLKAELQYQNQTSLINNRNQSDEESFMVRDQINRFMNKDASGKLVYPFPFGDMLDLSNITFKAWNFRTSLRFNKQFNDHAVSAFMGMELRESDAERNSNTLYGYNSETYSSSPINLVEIFPQRPLGFGLIGSMIASSGRLTRHGSFFGNMAYSYKGKYLATLSGRTDQSNFFGVKANLRQVPLWSAGLGWNIHLEDFYHIEWLSNLKLKFSYGYTGNTNPGATSYAIFSNSTENNGVPPRDISYGEIIKPNNPELKWERNKIINLGIEFAWKNNRVNGSFEFYEKNGLDLLGPINTDPTSGFSSYVGNRASMVTRGIDFTLNTRNINAHIFKWDTNWLISFNKDKVLSFAGNVPLASQLVNSSVNVGDPLYSLYSYNFAGLNPVNGDPLIYISNNASAFENSASVAKSDLILSGQRNPKFFGSVINRFSYKQFSISANVTYRLGHYFRRSSINYSNLLNFGWSEHKDYSSRWRKTGDENFTNVPSMPVFGDISRDEVYLNSNILVESADHIRLQDIRLDYRLDKTTSKTGLFKQISFYMLAQNLGILWRANDKGLDPDAYSFGSIYAPKTISVGVNANF